MKILSAIQSTGEFHLGNYLGALKNWVRLQDEGNECLYFIADLHALTTIHDAKTLKENVLEAKTAMLAVGFDPRKATLFLQSSIREHAELAWILSSLTSLGDLERMTQYKDKSKVVGKTGLNSGLLTYPILMAADILMYNPDYVPVGEDQIQHLELTREIARKFNSAYGETFQEPKPLLRKETARILSLKDPSQKMSKSLGPQHYIGLFENEKSIREKVRSAVTDSGNAIKYDLDKKPAISNLLSIYSAISNLSIEEAEKKFRGASYVKFKESVADVLIKHLKPINSRYQQVKKNPALAEHSFGVGGEKARVEAKKTMEKVRKVVGI